MRKTSLDTIYQLAKTDKRIFFIGSDLGVGVMDNFKADMPDRYFMEGISEAHIVGMAAGLAMEGKIVYINTIATFITRRCFEQITLDLCLQNTNVRLIGNGGGLVYAPLGPTHEAIEDIAIMRALPRMTILAPADPEEMKAAVTASVDCAGPVYIRVARGGEPVVTGGAAPFEIGKARLMRAGGDALLVTTGITLKTALDAADILSNAGIQACVLHLPTMKPFDRAAVVEYARSVRAVVSIEEHSITGGLGSAVAEVLSETDFPTPKRFKRIGIPDVFPDKYGSQASLMSYFGIAPEHIAATVTELCGSAVYR